MAEDKRELILDRLHQLFKTVVAEANSFRNRIDVPEKSRPAIVVLDADEVADQGATDRRRPGAAAPVIVGLTPEIYLLATGKPDAIGGTLNALRIQVIKAVLTDASLLALCHNGDIRYEGFATGLASGRSMEGEAGISFTFNYALEPAKL